ncbi:MAG: Rieske (2Fe-2S) protein [Cytophagales bacterium]|nr:Rieske (2Fe-2S) protein [Bernardetiaceae bacterium]MDW8204282.1 Rieske (2Fe-2S) protein [Cytophagales bacterium]
MAKYLLFPSQAAAKERVPLFQTALIRAGKLEICLAHTPEGFFAVSNECTHQRASMHKGKVLPECKIQCPWHGYTFSLKTGEDLSGNDCPALKTYPIHVSEKGIEIEL